MSTQYSDTVKVRQTVSSRQWLSDPAGDDKLYTRPRHSVEILVENREPAFCLVENEISFPYRDTHTYRTLVHIICIRFGFHTSTMASAVAHGRTGATAAPGGGK